MIRREDLREENGVYVLICRFRGTTDTVATVAHRGAKAWVTDTIGSDGRRMTRMRIPSTMQEKIQRSSS